LVCFVFSMAQTLKAPVEILAQEAIELTTTLIEPLLQPPPKPPEPQLKKPEPQQKLLTPANVPKTTVPIEPAKDVTPSEAPRPSSTPAPAPPPLPSPSPSVTPVAPVPEAPKPAPQPPASVNLENNYIASVRATLNANKRYPTGREASLQRPSGKVKLWFVLARNGSLQEAGIEESSNSIILDNAALSTVRRTTYAPWPEGSWPSQPQHKFSVTLDFVPLN